MSCKHATPVPGRQYVACGLNLFGGRPSPGVCATCRMYDGPSRGLGDTVAAVAKAVGVRRVCGGCARRRAILNRLAPYAAKTET